MDRKDGSDNKHPSTRSITLADGFKQAAFKLHKAFGDSIRPNLLASQGGKSAQGPFRFSFWQASGRFVHPFGHVSMDEIDYELACGKNVGACIFKLPFFSPDGAESQAWRINSAWHKVAEWG